MSIYYPPEHAAHDVGDMLTCGTCGREWCGICVPTPAARCAFEYDHAEPEDEWPEDDLDAVVGAVREHSGDYIAMVEGLVEEIRDLRGRLGL